MRRISLSSHSQAPVTSAMAPGHTGVQDKEEEKEAKPAVYDHQVPRVEAIHRQAARYARLRGE